MLQGSGDTMTKKTGTWITRNEEFFVKQFMVQIVFAQFSL